MKIIKERSKYENTESVWVGKYKNSQNLLHWHYHCELLYVMEGSIEVVCEQKNYLLSAGNAFFIDSEQTHFMHALSPECIVILITFDYKIIKPFANNLMLVSPVLSKDYHIPAIYQLLKSELKNKPAFYENKTCDIISQLFIEIFRQEAVCAKQKEKLAKEQFKKLLDDIQVNYEFYTFEKAVSFMHMAPTYFSKIFNNNVGMPFSTYLNYVKISNAIELLRAENNLSMTEIALRCGFSTIRNFNKTFKKITGFSPSRLPDKFILTQTYFSKNQKAENPTLPDCALIE